MKFLLLAFLISPILASAQGLIQVPDTAVDSARSTGLIFDTGGLSPEEWTGAVREKVLVMKKQALANRAASIRASAEVGCFASPAAFGFEQVSETDFKVNCLAGTAKDFTHVLDYRFTIVQLPTNCGSDQLILEYFKIPNNRNINAANALWNDIKNRCTMQVNPADPANPIVKNVAITPDFADATVKANPALKSVIESKVAPKRATAKPVFISPLKQGAISAD